MTIVPQELYGSSTTIPQHANVVPKIVQAVKLAAISGGPTLPHLTPLAFDETAGFWKVWDDTVASETYVITANATPASGGTFTLTVDGATTATIAYNANAAAILAALNALPNISPGDVSVTDGGGGLATGSGTATIVFLSTGAFGGKAVTLTAAFGSLTGNTHVLTNTVDGSGSDTDQIDAFLWEPSRNGHVSSASGETWVNAMLAGELPYNVIPLPTTSSQTQNGLAAALKKQNVRALGFTIRGLDGVH